MDNFNNQYNNGYDQYNNVNSNPNQKQKMIAGLLAIFLGAYGVHNFYLGFKKKAITQLIIGVVGFLLSFIIIGIIPLAVVGVWAIIDAVNIFTGKIACDADGLPLV